MPKLENENNQDIIAVNVFKNPEEDRKNVFLDSMVRTIARSEKNLKIAKGEGSTTN